jgi:hypothetical protein
MAPSKAALDGLRGVLVRVRCKLPKDCGGQRQRTGAAPASLGTRREKSHPHRLFKKYVSIIPLPLISIIPRRSSFKRSPSAARVAAET